VAETAPFVWQGRCEDHENTWLRWVDASGEPIPTGAEQAEQQRRRADEEFQRAERERQRAERLAEQPCEFRIRRLFLIRLTASRRRQRTQ
jgi:hypothetical protein